MSENKHELLLVLWKDVLSDGGWGIPTKLDQPPICQSIAWKVHETEDTLFLAAAIAADGHEDGWVGNTTSLPKCLIEEMYTIEFIDAEET